ncbi:MAG: DUF3577 domain-containing protein [Gammaproteobacteria bacterium]|nr:DUF3577 domain-containing protein [Gammaproteobacteria bacterium]
MLQPSHHRPRLCKPFHKAEPSRGQPFYAVNISALHGNVDHPKYTLFYLRVSGANILKRMWTLQSAINAEMAVLMGFIIGDIYPDIVEYKLGKKQGQTGCIIKGRLLQVQWAKIDGVHVFAGEDHA